MPDRRRHRGPSPLDDALFAPDALPPLRAAAQDLAWLLTRGYVVPSALKLVGDRHGLRERQRMAVYRSTCSDPERAARRAREVDPRDLAGADVWIDGLNVLITVEAALAGGALLLGRDGCLRDLASLSGSFHRVLETDAALGAIGAWLATRDVRLARWLLDRPVSNSGRLAARMREVAAASGFPWEVELVPSPDAALAGAPVVVATSDRAVLDRAARWLNLARHVVAATVPGARWISFEDGPASGDARGPAEQGQ